MHKTQENNFGRVALVLLCLLSPAVFSGCLDGGASGPPAGPEVQEGEVVPTAPPVYGYEIVNTFPHDRAAFTQGLAYDNGVFYEGTGLYGKSSLRRVDIVSGEVQQRVDLDSAYFGEGIVLWGDQILQLTWQENTGFIYQRDTFEKTGEFSYSTEGWGITHDGQRLIMSDGTHVLRFLDPATRAEIGSLKVRNGDRYITRLNELEYVNGEIFANIWTTDYIARIDPATGTVTGWIHLEGLLEHAGDTAGADVLNGIAYDAGGDRLFVTGKKWPAVFEIRLVAPRSTKSVTN